MKLTVPSSGLVSPQNWGSRDSIKKMIQSIIGRYRSAISFASATNKIPASIITAFIAVESGGDPKAGGAGHITQGLMQWNREFAKENLEVEYKLGRLSDAEKERLAKFNISFDKNGKTRQITNQDQLNPELNILIGSIILGQLIDSKWAYDGKELRLDRVIAVYNAGAFGDTGKKARLGNFQTAKSLADAVNPVTRSYISKMVGVNGALDIIKTDSLI